MPENKSVDFVTVFSLILRFCRAIADVLSNQTDAKRAF